MRKKDCLKALLSKGKMVIGTWCEVPSPEIINVLAKAGLDFVIIDMEHGAMDYQLASNMVLAAEVENCFPLIRVPKNDESDILRALEIAPEGIIIPHIESEEDRARTVRFAKFPPIGERSLNPYTRAGNYHSHKEFTKEQNENSFVGVIVEGKEGIKNIEMIIDDKNIDLVYIGTYDISSMLGIPGDTKNPLVFEAMKRIAKLVRSRDKAVGCLFHDKEEMRLFQRLGLQLLCYKVDTSILFDEIQHILKYK